MIDDLRIDNIEVFPPYTQKEENIFIHDGCIRISWSGSSGFGQYDLWKDEFGKWHGSSEYIDSQDDKSFINELMGLFLKDIIIDD